MRDDTWLHALAVAAVLLALAGQVAGGFLHGGPSPGYQGVYDGNPPRTNMAWPD